MKFTPHDYQKYCITRIIQQPALVLLLDMGLGKTVITLTAVNDLHYNRFLVRKCLVIAPKKVAEDTWIREQGKWDHLSKLRVISVLGTKQRRIRALNSSADVYVINRENVTWLVDYYKNDWPFDMVVIDESSSFKSSQAKRFKSLKAIRCHISRIVLLTGTPTPNGLTDLWAQMYLIDQGARLGKTITEYRNTWFHPDKRNASTIFSYAPLPGAEDVIRDRVKDVCISLQAKDYLQLPEKISNVRYIQLDEKAHKAYVTLERQRVLETPMEVIDAGSAGVLAGKLLQLANGACYVVSNPEHPEKREVAEIHDNKLQAFLELLEELDGQHVFVFYNFQHDQARIRKVLGKSKYRIRDADGPADYDAWNAGEVDILLAHPASVAYGLNLQQGGHHVVWFGLNWSLELYLQANARLHRQGQRHSVMIHHLVVAGSVDEDVMGALEAKGDSQEALLTALKARITKYKEMEDDKNNG